MRYRLMPVDGFAYMENQRYPVLRLGDEIKLEAIQSSSMVEPPAHNRTVTGSSPVSGTKYVPVDPDKPEGFFTVPELKKECGLHVWTEKASDNCPVCNRCGIHARDDYGWKRKECTEDIERVAEWLRQQLLKSSMPTKEIAKKLLEAGLQPERLK